MILEAIHKIKNRFLRGIVLGILAGITIGYLIERIGIQVQDRTGEIAQVISSKPVAIWSIVIILFLVMLATAIYMTIRSIKDVVGIYRSFRRMQRIKRIRKYGYIGG